jgi:hypothetical protein
MGGSFPNGVPEASFARLCSVLQRSCDEGQLTPISGGWQTTRDLCYTSQLRVTLDQDGGREIIRKRLLHRVDMSGHTYQGAQAHDGPCRMRFSWKSETKIAEPSPEELGMLEGVRHKQRISFAYKMWRFDLSIIRGAACDNELMIDEAVAVADCSYEVEMELVPSACALGETPAPYLAHSMLLKAQDICGILLNSLERSAPGRPQDFDSPGVW